MKLNEHDLEKIKDIIKNDIILSGDCLDYEFNDDDVNLFEVITSLYNLLYEVCTGKKYDYFFHWFNKVGMSVDTNERYFDKFLTKDENTMSLDELFKILDTLPHIKTPLIVRLQYKYDFEKEYTESNEILEFDTNINDWVWLNDWDEGQNDIRVMWWVAVDDLKEGDKQ